MSHMQTLFMRGVSGEPLHIERAEGAYLYTRDGKKILDGAAGAVVVNIGQGREEIAKLAAEEMARLNYIVPVWVSPARERLVERLSRWTPEGINRFYFTSGGSEAVEAALKFAIFYNTTRQRPRKKLIVSRRTSYHGATLAALSVGGNRARRADYEQALIDWPKIDPSYCYRCPWGKTYPACDLDCATALEVAITTHGAENIAAFVAEPIVGASGGVITPVREYWPRIAEICRRNDILLIADEVMTGFGRTGKKFAVEHWNINPDVIIGGKGLTGGYLPMGMIGVQDRLVEECEQAGGDFMFFTYSALPVVCAVADRVLEIMEREELVERSATVGARLGARLKETLGDHPMVGDIRGLGLFWAVEMVRDRASRDPFPQRSHLTNKVIGAAMRRGLFVYPSTGMAGDKGGDAVMITPPFIIGDAEIEFIATTLRAALEDIRAVVM
jgi:adenosylmethionine-8-amino-7-oxononanoate aminotransferase